MLQLPFFSAISVISAVKSFFFSAYDKKRPPEIFVSLRFLRVFFKFLTVQTDSDTPYSAPLSIPSTSCPHVPSTFTPYSFSPPLASGPVRCTRRNRFSAGM